MNLNIFHIFFILILLISLYSSKDLITRLRDNETLMSTIIESKDFSDEEKESLIKYSEERIIPIPIYFLINVIFSAFVVFVAIIICKVLNII